MGLAGHCLVALHLKQGPRLSNKWGPPQRRSGLPPFKTRRDSSSTESLAFTGCRSTAGCATRTIVSSATSSDGSNHSTQSGLRSRPEPRPPPACPEKLGTFRKDTVPATHRRQDEVAARRVLPAGYRTVRVSVLSYQGLPCRLIASAVRPACSPPGHQRGPARRCRRHPPEASPRAR